MDDRILLRGGVLRLWHHLIEALGQRHEHRIRIAAVFEMAFSKPQRGRQRSWLLFRAVAHDTQRLVNRRAFIQRLRIPSGNDLRVVAALQRLHPAAAAFDDRLTACFRCVREVRRVRSSAVVFEKQRHFIIRQRTLPHAHRSDVSLCEITREIRSGTPHFEDVVFLIGLRELGFLSDLLSIQPQARRTIAHLEHSRVWLAIVHLRTARHGTEPADVIHEPSTANEESLRIW